MKYFLATAILFASLHGTAAADDAADAKALLDKVIETNGGEEALGKIVGQSFKGKCTSYDDNEKTTCTVEWFVQGDDKSRNISKQGDAATPDIEVVNGNKGWWKEAGKDSEDLSDEDLADTRERVYLTWITNYVPLKGKDYHLSPLDEIDIDGRKAAGLLVKHDKHEPVKLYFDKESHLLVKWQRPVKDGATGKTFSEEVVFSDYTTVQGTKQARKTVTFWDSKKVGEAEMDTKNYDKPLDEKLFVKP